MILNGHLKTGNLRTKIADNLMHSQKNIILLHCFPVPYRNHLFKSINDVATERGISFRVHFFSDFDESRPTWKFKSEDLNYAHKFWKLDFKRGPVLHLNIGLLKYIKKEKPDLIISGGVWSSINSILLILFSKKTIVGWDETNRFDFGSVKKNHLFFKRALINKLKYIAIPGKESQFYYKELLNENFDKKKFLNLPNLVDESLFANPNEIDDSYKATIFNKYNLPQNKKIVYWPARFIKEKGIENFLNYLNAEILNDWIIIIVGNGPLRANVEKIIEQKKLSDFIYIIDILPYEESIKFYLIANMVIMPSISDSNPLSLVEAIHSHLPLLISNRVGNLHEVMLEGKNGLSFDPFDSSSASIAINLMFSKTKEELKQMGLESKLLANKNFNTKKIINEFFDDIMYKYKLL